MALEGTCFAEGSACRARGTSAKSASRQRLIARRFEPICRTLAAPGTGLRSRGSAQLPEEICDETLWRTSLALEWPVWMHRRTHAARGTRPRSRDPVDTVRQRHRGDDLSSGIHPRSHDHTARRRDSVSGRRRALRVRDRHRRSDHRQQGRWSLPPHGYRRGDRRPARNPHPGFDAADARLRPAVPPS